MKRALIVSNTSGLITLFLGNDIKLLKERGYEIDCVCNTKFPDKNTEVFLKENNINVKHIEFPIRDLNIKSLISSYIDLNKIIKKNKYDLIHCHTTIASVIARQCGKATRKKGTKIIYTSHGFPFYEGNFKGKAKLFYLIEKYYSKYTDAIITICTEDFENASKMKCLNVFKINGVGVDLSKFINLKIDREKYRKQLGFNVNDKVILSIGEINTNKNHKIIIEALSKTNDCDYIYAICGREVTEFGKKQELIDLAKKLNVRVKFLGFRSDIPEICYCSDIGALPSYKEGLGLSGIEILASGIPIVASNRQGIKDYVINNFTGYLCDPNMSDTFFYGLKEVEKLKEKKNTNNNCISMAKKFDIKNSYLKMKEIFDKIL